MEQETQCDNQAVVTTTAKYYAPQTPAKVSEAKQSKSKAGKIHPS